MVYNIYFIISVTLIDIHVKEAALLINLTILMPRMVFLTLKKIQKIINLNFYSTVTEIIKTVNNDLR